MPSPAAAEDRKPAKVFGGIVRVTGKSPGPFTISWRESAKAPRIRAMRSTWADAKKLAEQKANDIANHRTAIDGFGETDRARYLSWLRQFALLGVDADIGFNDYFGARRLVNERAAGETVQNLVNFALEHRPAGVTPKTVPDIVTLLIDRKRADEKGEKWISSLKQQLDRFAEKFNCPIHLLQAHEINAWLRGLVGKAGKPVSLVTRANYRNAVRELVRFAQAENYLDKTWDQLKHVDDPEPPPVEARIYTPEETVRLLACAQENLIPFLAIMLFAGVRHEEMSAAGKTLVTWSDILWDKGLIKIRKTVGKTKRQRLIQMSDNLKAWLQPYVKRSGKICELACTGDALYRLGKRAGIPWRKNACRKSFISYRLAQTNDIGLVAREAGNSQRIIEQNYLELVTPDQASAYFAIQPQFTSDKLVQVEFGFRT